MPCRWIMPIQFSPTRDIHEGFQLPSCPWMNGGFIFPNVYALAFTLHWPTKDKYIHSGIQPHSTLYFLLWYYWTGNIYFFQRLHGFPPGPYCICLRRDDCCLETILLLTRELKIFILFLISKFILHFVTVKLDLAPMAELPWGQNSVQWILNVSGKFIRIL